MSVAGICIIRYRPSTALRIKVNKQGFQISQEPTQWVKQRQRILFWKQEQTIANENIKKLQPKKPSNGAF